MTATLIFGQNVNLSGEFGMAGNSTRFSNNLSTNDICSLNTTKQSTDVITSLCLIQEFTEHLDTGYNSFLLLLFNAKDFNLIVQMKNTTLYTTGSYSTTTSDGEYVLDRHKERLVGITLRIRNVGIYGIHKLHDLVAPLTVRILKSLQSGTSG